jgi:hypothetical protein
VPHVYNTDASIAVHPSASGTRLNMRSPHESESSMKNLNLVIRFSNCLQQPGYCHCWVALRDGTSRMALKTNYGKKRSVHGLKPSFLNW